MNDSNRFVAAAMVVAALLTGVPVAHAVPGKTEAGCRKDRYDTALKYIACQQKVLGRRSGGLIVDESFNPRLSRCRVKYTSRWARLQVRYEGTGTTCDNPRYDVTGDGTVSDRLTGLQWELKTDDGSIHDLDDTYMWNTSGMTPAANGSAFTSFLATLNGGSCFAGHCDWRLPTVYELQTILLAPYPCSGACIDTAVFGSAVASQYVTATTYLENPLEVWFVTFSHGRVLELGKHTPNGVRAVRGGL